ncbi:MAG: hypothetical protein NTW08_08185 [Gammaproteobacteria bacterium]|nr:hypothetical protein [Gammaproteobacteria bacterium]
MKSKLLFMCLSLIALGSQTVNAAAFVPAKKTVSLPAVNHHRPMNGAYHPARHFPEPQFRPKQYPEPQIKPNQQRNTKDFPGEDWRKAQNQKQSGRAYQKNTNKVTPKGFMPETFKTSPPQ